MRSTLPGRSPALVLSIALCTACGPPARPLAGPHATEDGSEEGAQIFAPSGRAVILYNGPAGEAPPREPLFDSVLAVAFQAARSAGKPILVSDPRLYAVAADLAAIIPRQGLLPYAPVEFALSHYGIIEPTPTVSVVFADPRQTAEMASHFAERMRQLIADDDYARIGIGTAPRDKGQNATVVLLQRSFVEAEPIPRVMQAGDAFELRGRILAPFRHPGVVVTRDDGQVVELPLRRRAARSDDTFRVEVGCEGRVGRQQVEVTAVSERGPAVLANFPIWCATEAPSQIVWRPREGHREAEDLAAAELAMVRMVNEARRAAGLNELVVDPDVAGVARQHSAEMAQMGVVAHTLESTGTAGDRLRRAGIRAAVVAENLARAGDTEDAHRSLMNSPGHRVNILLPEMTHIGVGIVPGPGQDAGHGDLFVTQLYVRRSQKVDLAATRQRVREVLGRKVNLATSSTLDALAQTQADAIAGGTPNDEATQATASALLKQSSKLTLLRATFSAVPAIEAFTAPGVEGDPRLTHYGVGVAQGHHDELGDNTIFVVLLLATARDPAAT